MDNLIIDPEINDKGLDANNVDEIDILSHGQLILQISALESEQIGAKWNNFYSVVQTKRNRQVTRNAATMIQGAIFAVGSVRVNNLEWKEHCASSLREIVHEWSGLEQLKIDFQLVFRHPNKLSEDDRLVLSEIYEHYKYFSSVAHHEASNAMQSLQHILKDQSIKIDQALSQEMFISRTKYFFELLKYVPQVMPPTP